MNVKQNPDGQTVAIVGVAALAIGAAGLIWWRNKNKQPPADTLSYVGGYVTHLGTGLPGASVTIAGVTETTDEQGAFQFTQGVNPGSIEVTASAAGYVTKTRQFTVISGQVLIGVELDSEIVNQLAYVSGLVTHSGTGIANASVTMAGYPATSDSQGGYSIANGITPGTVVVTATAEGYENYIGQTTLQEGSNTVDIEMIPIVVPPPDAVTISGTITSGGAALQGATMTLSAADGSSLSATSGTQGGYQFSIVPNPPFSTSPIGQTINWTCAKEGFITAQGSFVCAQHQTIDVNLAAEPPPIGAAFTYSNVAVSTWSDYNRLGTWLGPLFTCRITNNSSQAVTHDIKMMWRRTYNGNPDFGPAQAYSNPSSLTLNPGQSFNFSCDGYNPVRAAMDILIVPGQYSAGVRYYFWLEDEAGRKSAEVTIY